MKGYKKKFSLPVGFGWLFLWFLFIALFALNTNFYTKSIGYLFWLMLDILSVLVAVQLFSTKLEVLELMKVYIFSYALMAVVGIVQFVLPVLNLGSFCVQQWWIENSIPRVNAFTYEPSFYATYMIMGWVLCVFLLESSQRVFDKYMVATATILITAALILSSSRMGMLFLFFWFCKYPIKLVIKATDMKLPLKEICITSILACVIALATNYLNYDLYFTGLSMSGVDNWSAETRINRTMETLNLFFQSPLIGYSLGGVSSGIAELHGLTTISTWEELKSYEGNTIFVEVLAASGLVGTIPFVMYIWSIFSQPFKRSLATLPDDSFLLQAMVIALFFEFAILQFNQVILRPYLWLHIAVLSALFNVSRRTSMAVADRIKI